ncbi:major facilitator superfamily domain-containing protein [Bisporella sp. PMI_857]|nr:major facilitator superfamily domain-containing protein [Bisporella sp. PMI_857]
MSSGPKSSSTSISDLQKPPATPHRESSQIPLDETSLEKQEVGAPAAGSPAAVWGADAPDGGAVAWLCVLGAWCTSFCSFGWINSIGTFQDYYQTHLLRQYSPEKISWIPSLELFFMFAMGPIVGKFYDRYGPRYLTFVGTILHVFGLMMASISKEYYQILLSQGICSAVGLSLIFQPALSCVGGWFNKKRGTAFGILSTGSSVGGVIFPIMVSRLIEQVGYGWAMRISAFLILFLLVVANLTVKSRFPPNPQVTTRQQLAAPFTEITFLAIMVGLMIFTFGMFVPINYMVVEATSAGRMDASLARYLVAIFNAGSLLGRLATGILADRFGKYNVFVVASYTSGILTLALWLPLGHRNNVGRILYSLFYGAFSGAYVSLIPALVAQISPVWEIGFRTGLIFSVSSIGALTTSPIAGAILAHQDGHWSGTKIFAGVFCVVGTSFVVVARVFKTGWKPTAIF